MEGSRGARTLQKSRRLVSTSLLDDDDVTRLATQRDSRATSQDLLAVLLAAAAAFSAHDIAGFARTFVSARGAPVLTPSFVWNPTERTATVTLRQVQRVGPDGGFALPVVVELSDGTRTQRSTITLRGGSTVATVPIEFEPTRLTVDPDETAYLTTTCTADSQCHTGFTCGMLGREPARLCVPPRS